MYFCDTHLGNTWHRLFERYIGILLPKKVPKRKTSQILRKRVICDYLLLIVAIETPGGKRNLNININAQEAILKEHTDQNNSNNYKNLFANVSLLHRNIIRASSIH